LLEEITEHQHETAENWESQIDVANGSLINLLQIDQIQD